MNEENTLKPEQQKELHKVFQWRDAAEMSEDELQRLREMFTEPKDFYILRKALGLFMPEERGLLLPHKAANMTKEDYEIAQAADEQVRGSLSNLYRVLRNEKVAEKTKEFEEANEEERKEAERVEEIEEEAEINSRQTGPNV